MSVIRYSMSEFPVFRRGDTYAPYLSIRMPQLALLRMPAEQWDFDIPPEAYRFSDRVYLDGYVFWHDCVGPGDPLGQGLVWVLRIFGRQMVFAGDGRAPVEMLRERGAYPVGEGVQPMQVTFVDRPEVFLDLPGDFVKHVGVWLEYVFGKWMWDHREQQMFYRPLPSDELRYDGWAMRTRADEAEAWEPVPPRPAAKEAA